MPRHIFINRESNNDHISIFYDEPAFIVLADKDDLPKINILEESHKPGIYILIGEHQRYIGQASGSIFSRLQQHFINKNWWHKVIFFGRDDGHLNKAQLDFLEAKLINAFSQSNFKVDNTTTGNHSYIDKMSKITANSLLKLVEDTLSNVSNINLFDDLNSSEHELIDESSLHSVTFKSKRYISKSTRKILLDLVKDIIVTDDLLILAPIISNSLPSTTYFIGTENRISSKGTELSQVISETPYHLYVTFSTKVIEKKLQLIADLTHHPIEFNF